MPVQYPSLSELTQAMQTPGPGSVISAGTQGLVTGLSTAAEMAARKQALLNKLQELGIMQQQADTQTAAEKSKFIDADQFNAAVAGQPVTGPVNTNFADALARMKEAAEARKMADERMRFEGEQNRLSREQVAAEGNATRQQAANTAAQTAKDNQFENAAKQVESLHWYDKLFNTQANQAANEQYNFARQQAGAGSNDAVGDYLKQIGAKDTPDNRKWAQSKVSK